MVRINEHISYIQGSEEPLSCNVFFIYGASRTYVVDVGRGDRLIQSIKTIPDKKVIITHFHGDHTENLAALNIPDEDLYVGDYTFKSLKRGTVVSNILEIKDGITIRIIPMPSSHSKGSLTVLVNGEYLITGDSYYCSDRGYNVSLLYDQIKAIKDIDFEYGLFGHGGSKMSKADMVAELEETYGLREKGNPWIKPW